MTTPKMAAVVVTIRRRLVRRVAADIMARAKLVAKLGSFLVLNPPAHQARPVGEEGLVNDLDPTGRFLIPLLDLVRRQQPGIDELAQDLFRRSPLYVVEH